MSDDELPEDPFPATEPEFPVWPAPWVEDYELTGEEELAATEAIVFRTAERSDRQVLMGITWPEGRRWLMVEPVGLDVPVSYRVGELAEDPDTARIVEGLWSQALLVAKKLLDGDISSLVDVIQQAGGDAAEPEDEGRRRPWRRGGGRD